MFACFAKGVASFQLPVPSCLRWQLATNNWQLISAPRELPVPSCLRWQLATNNWQLTSEPLSHFSNPPSAHASAPLPPPTSPPSDSPPSQTPSTIHPTPP